MQNIWEKINSSNALGFGLVWNTNVNLISEASSNELLRPRNDLWDFITCKMHGMKHSPQRKSSKSKLILRITTIALIQRIIWLVWFH